MAIRQMCVALCVLAACGDDGGGGGGGTTDGSVDSPRSIDAPISPSAKKRGTVLIVEETLQPIGTLTLEAADFADATAAAGITERVDGQCVIRKTDAASIGTRVSAGNVTITNGADVVTLMPGTGNQYMAMQQQGAHYAAGAVLTIAGAGATVPAFSRMVTFPSAVTVASPPPLAKTGYSVSWTGSGPVRIMIAQSANVLIQCDYPTGTSATIPASALSDLITGTGSSMQITILIGAVASTTLTAGAYNLELTAFNAGYAAVTFIQ